jgi:hypothetical protein
MKAIILIACLTVLLFTHAAAQTPQSPQQAFCRFVQAFNERNFNDIYDNLSPAFQAQIDRAVCTGGLLHIYSINGPVQSGAIESESPDEGAYYAITESGIFKVLLSIDKQQRIDGLRILQLAKEHQKAHTSGPALSSLRQLNPSVLNTAQR